MSIMSDYDLQLQEVARAISEPDLTAEDQMERRIDGIIRELDELCAFAANPETVDLIEGKRVMIGQVIFRANLIGSFLMARQPHLRVVSRG